MIKCPSSFSVTLTKGSLADQVEWYYPVLRDNVAIDTITHNHEPLERYELGSYTVVAYVNDTSGNLSPPCSFTFTVVDYDQTTAAPAASSADASTGSAIGAAGGTIALLILILIVIMFVRSRRKPQKEEATDEDILAHAQVCCDVVFSFHLTPIAGHHAGSACQQARQCPGAARVVAYVPSRRVSAPASQPQGAPKCHRCTAQRAAA